MVKIRLYDDEEVDTSEAFLDLVKHSSGFAVVLKDIDGDIINQPYVLFLEPDGQGKLSLRLAQSPDNDFIDRHEVTNTIRVNSSR